MSNPLTIGIFGFGCVGQGLYDVLKNNVHFNAHLKKICIKHPEKNRTLSPEIFTTNKWELLDDPEINTIIELINDTGDAYFIITTALKRGKNVVTANKKVVAEHLEELIFLQKKHEVSLIYEASACGGIPIIRTLEEYYDNEELRSVSGIFNGSSNYILTKIYQEGLSYEEALKQAQDLGFAETDPSLDVEGFDPKYKLVILALHAFGIVLQPSEVFNSGINCLSNTELKLYRETGIAIKLNPVLKRTDNGNLVAFVLPQLIRNDHSIYHVNNEYNAVTVEGVFSDEQLFIGKGAGGHPTGSAVLSDLSALSYQYKYAYKKYYQQQEIRLNNSYELLLYISGKKNAIRELFPGEDISELEEAAFVITKKPITWLIEKTDILQKYQLFLAQIHPEAIENIREWQKQLEDAFLAV
jgi:homoserine dehydrogenase